MPCSYRYTVLFAVARTVGWVSQWKEMAEEKLSKISRPRQVGQAGVAGLLSRAEVCEPLHAASAPLLLPSQATEHVRQSEHCWPVTLLYCADGLAV